MTLKVIVPMVEEKQKEGEYKLPRMNTHHFFEGDEIHYLEYIEGPLNPEINKALDSKYGNKRTGATSFIGNIKCKGIHLFSICNIERGTSRYVMAIGSELFLMNSNGKTIDRF